MEDEGWSIEDCSEDLGAFSILNLRLLILVLEVVGA
jgi:hypothetical protein